MEKKVSIYEALVKARKGFKTVKKDAINPFFKKKYASLGAIIEAVEESLLENGLWFKFDEEPVDLSKVIATKDGSKVVINTIKTIIYNAEGDTIITPHSYVVEELTSQGLGKASTYAQRYGLSAALGIVSEDDEDGNTKKQQQSAQQPQAKPATSAKPAETKPAQPVKSKTLKEIGNTEGVTVTEDDNIVTVSGKTFALANDLRSLGFSWDGQTKTWAKSKSQSQAA
jgi:hypothetical protein